MSSRRLTSDGSRAEESLTRLLSRFPSQPPTSESLNAWTEYSSKNASTCLAAVGTLVEGTLNREPPQRWAERTVDSATNGLEADGKLILRHLESKRDYVSYIFSHALTSNLIDFLETEAPEARGHFVRALECLTIAAWLVDRHFSPSSTHGRVSSMLDAAIQSILSASASYRPEPGLHYTDAFYGRVSNIDGLFAHLSGSSHDPQTEGVINYFIVYGLIQSCTTVVKTAFAYEMTEVLRSTCWETSPTLSLESNERLLSSRVRSAFESPQAFELAGGVDMLYPITKAILDIFPTEEKPKRFQDCIRPYLTIAHATKNEKCLQSAVALAARNVDVESLVDAAVLRASWDPLSSLSVGKELSKYAKRKHSSQVCFFPADDQGAFNVTVGGKYLRAPPNGVGIPVVADSTLPSRDKDYEFQINVVSAGGAGDDDSTDFITISKGSCFLVPSVRGWEMTNSPEDAARAELQRLRVERVAYVCTGSEDDMETSFLTLSDDGASLARGDFGTKWNDFAMRAMERLWSLKRTKDALELALHGGAKEELVALRRSNPGERDDVAWIGAVLADKFNVAAVFASEYSSPLDDFRAAIAKLAQSASRND